MEPVRLRPGETGRVSIPFTIKEGYHIQADTVSDENLIHTELTIDTSGGFEVGDPVYPGFRYFELKGTNDSLLVFDGVINIVVTVKAADTTAPGNYELTGSLTYQACDSVRCLFPRKLNFQLDISLVNL